MKSNSLRLVLGIFSAGLFSGCAFTVHDVEVNHAYNLPIARTFESAEASIAIERIDDRRTSAASERMIFQQTNLNGDRTSGGWQAEKPVVEIISDSLADGLSKAGLPIVSLEGDLILSGELVELDYAIITGFWKGQLNSEMVVKLELQRASDGEILWRETYFAKDSTDKFEIKEVLNRLLDDLVTQVIDDNFFRQTLAKQP